jgi:hypothetical protein
VLGKNGCLFINEEPMDSSFRQFLRGNRHLYNPPRGILQKLAYKLRIENIFWDVRSKDKAEGKKFAHFNIELWRLVTAPFSYRDIEVNSRLRVHSNLYKPRFNVIISKIVGGNVRGILTKRDGDYAQNEFRDRLMCIECFSTSLIRNAYSLKCSSCDREYPITHNGIIRILPKYLEQELYGHLE